MKPNVYRDEQVKLIMECCRSGLSDYQWCEQHDIHPGTFYNWVSKLKKKGYTFPDSNYKTAGTPITQEVIKVDLIKQDDLPPSVIEQNTSALASFHQPAIAAEIIVGNITLRLFNGAEPDLIKNTMRCLGGADHAW
ncbi:IS66 family insertion sequence element accessory protein TnpA [Novisyntrophococcus fermenticellae]|uniref:IS66 family insertion sequence element accessory protein TnpA n=1 Tax=Novisyntrophococcus fermenticellae TaxID=2068655 RepID=UPI001E380D1F|nr:transposase [Novisyntrophococcus fermenticellae]